MDLFDSSFSLRDRKILVTGASSGIGRACAIKASELGAHIVVCGRNEQRLQETVAALSGEGHAKFIGDLTDNEVVKRLLDEISELDGVVFSAGVAKTLPFLFSDQESFKKVFDVNFFSPTEILRQITKSKALKNGASVVFISSLSSGEKLAVGNSIYGTSKAAVNSIVQYSALELSAQKIRVNAICPGVVNTPMVGDHNEKIKEIVLSNQIKNCPLKRIGEPEDIANMAVFLLSDASSWVTGQAICVDGGSSLV